MSEADLVIGLPALGFDTIEVLADHPGFTLQHGSSLSLMSIVGEFLNNSNEFKSIDVTTDWEKWSTRSQDFALYYAAVLNEETGQVVGALRAITDGEFSSHIYVSIPIMPFISLFQSKGHPSPRPPHRRRLVIDYVTVSEEYRGRGYVDQFF